MNMVLLHVMRALSELLRNNIFFDREHLYLRAGVREKLLAQHIEIGEAVLAGSSFRGHATSRDSTVPWLYASDGAGLADQLERLGLLDPAPQQPEVEA